MKRFLFDGKYAPLTNRISFVDASVEKVIEAYKQWINERINIQTKQIEYNVSFEELLELSLPFQYPRKDMILETTSKWTGIYTNLNTEVYVDWSVSKRLNVSMIYVMAEPSYFKKIVNGWGGGAFSFYRGKELVRHLMLSDQDRWEFDNYGEPFPFEDTEKYKEKFARNRFTPEMLDKYLKEFGIDFFNEDFYMPKGSKAYIMEHVRPPFENEKPISLQDMRKHLMYE